MAVGDWPKPGCQIIVPWFQKQRRFEWGGSLEATPEFLVALDEPTIDCKKSKIETELSTNEETIVPLRKMVTESYAHFLTFKPGKFQAIRDLYCLFLQNALGHDLGDSFKKGGAGPFYYSYQRGFFAGSSSAEKGKEVEASAADIASPVKK